MITVLGSVNLDLIGTVSRIPQPGETVPGGAFATAAGGKGANQALAARRAGAAVRMVGAAGEDSFADEALTLLRAGGVELSQLKLVAGPTGIAMILVDSRGENVIAILPGANGAVGPAEADAALAGLGPGDVLLLQQEIPQATTARALELARTQGVTSILNTAPFLDDTQVLARSAAIVVANETEFALLSGGEASPLEEAMRQWAEANGQTVIVTLGPEGAWATHAGRILKVPALPIEPVDTVGAGDTFCGYLAAGLDAGLALEAAIRRATVAGSLACLKAGAQPAIPYADAVEAALSSGSR
ncbi:MAG TPA: ribokinase [Devosiaceae bacterium]|jgi:ribokinase|nr:ribokinase [Devosiaceae bacterium]